VSEPSEDVASSLIEALASEGDHVDDGTFTLDPAKALQKLREYQLAEPLGYVLLLVEAAHLGDPNPRIELEVESSTRASFPGVILSDEQLCNPFSAVFRGSKDGSMRVLQLLGIAANAALAAGAERIEIQNIGADNRLRCVTIEQDGRARLDVHEPNDTRTPGHTVFCYIGGALRIGRAVKERLLLQERCKLASIPITVNGGRIDAGQKAAFPGLANLSTTSISVDEHGIVGTAARVGNEPAKLLLLTRSVLAETIELENCQTGLIAVVDIDLRKDLSQRQVLRDERFEALLAAIVRADERLPWSASSPDKRGETDKSWWGLLVLITFVGWVIMMMTMLITEWW
jgi:hypothetical protein